MKDILPKYLTAFKRLRIDRSHGVAPHKPVLLLSVLQAYRSKLITSSRIHITPELVAMFKTNWTQLVTTNHQCQFVYPFFYMKSEGFWKLIPKPGFEDYLQKSETVKSFNKLNAATEYALLNEELSELMKDKTSNEALQVFLLDTYFPGAKKSLVSYRKNQLEFLETLENKILNEDAGEYRKEIKKLMAEKDDEEIYLRGGAFKREIPKIYNNTCCISGLRIDATINVSMIDACHIVPFSESYDDTITNGIALCPNLHRAFDRGLIAIDNSYKVIVSKAFTENESVYGLKGLKEKKYCCRKNKNIYPRLIT